VNDATDYMRRSLRQKARTGRKPKHRQKPGGAASGRLLQSLVMLKLTGAVQCWWLALPVCRQALTVPSLFISPLPTCRLGSQIYHLPIASSLTSAARQMLESGSCKTEQRTCIRSVIETRTAVQAVAAQQLQNAAAEDEDAEEDIEEAGADSDGREPPADEEAGPLDDLDDDDEAEEAPKRKRRRKRRKRVIVQVTHWSWPKVKRYLLA